MHPFGRVSKWRCCHSLPSDELTKYAGQFVAFHSDGTCILASGATEDEVERQLEALGTDPSQVVGSYVPPCGWVLRQ